MNNTLGLENAAAIFSAEKQIAEQKNAISPRVEFQLSNADVENTENPISSSQQFQEMIAEPTTPGATVDLVERAIVLKDEFRYASTDTKIQILQSLSITTDLDFIIDALNYEEKTQVRQAAVHALFFSIDPLATTVMLETLDDADEILVMTVLHVLSRLEDETLNHQVSNILANRQSKAIKITLKRLGYTVFD